MKPIFALPLALLTAAALTACGVASPTQTPGATALSGTATGSTAQAARTQRAAIAPALYELVYSARQDAVFVASAGGFGPGAPQSKLLRLDPRTLAVQGEIALERKGFGLALDDAANRVYIGNTTDASITVVDVAANKVIATIQLAQKAKGADGKEAYPHHLRELVLDPANHRLYAPGLSSAGSALYVVDTRTLALEKVIPGFGQVATGVALDVAGQRLFVSNLRGGLFEVDTRTLAIRRNHAVGADQMLNLAYDAQGQRLFAVDQGLASISERREKAEPGFKATPGNRVVVLDPTDARIIASLPTGDGPIAPLLDLPRQRLYVTNRGAGTVTVFDSASYRLLQTIALPTHPNSLALDARNNVLYVSVKNGGGDEKGGKESVVRIAF